jgi:hypothetical protein
MNLTDDERDLIDRARELGPALRARTGDADRLAGWMLAELATLAEKLAENNVTVVQSHLARAAELVKAITADPDHARDSEWNTQDVINVALSRGLNAMERLYVKSDSS